MKEIPFQIDNISALISEAESLLKTDLDIKNLEEILLRLTNTISDISTGKTRGKTEYLRRLFELTEQITLLVESEKMVGS